MTERAVVDVGTREAPGGSFQVENPYLEQWLDKQSLELAGNVSETTTKNLQDTLSEGIRAGEGVPALRSRVEDSFETASRSRANLIARTESHTAASASSYIQATSSGVVSTKTWLSASDDRVRSEHQALNGETVGVNEPFSNGKMFPDEINCRCVLTFGISPELLGENSA